MESHSHGFYHYGQTLCNQNVRKSNFEVKYSWKSWSSREVYHFELKCSKKTLQRTNKLHVRSRAFEKNGTWRPFRLVLTACFYQFTEQNIKLWSNFKAITLTVVWFLRKMALKVFCWYTKILYKQNQYFKHILQKQDGYWIGNTSII